MIIVDFSAANSPVPHLSRAVNREVTTSLLTKENVVDGAFKRGIVDFRIGKRVPHTFTVLQKIDVHRRLMAIKEGKVAVAEKLTNKLLDQHIVLEDRYDDKDIIVHTSGYITTVADNPYRKNTIYAKEWQRGFDTAYHRNLRNLQRKA